MKIGHSGTTECREYHYQHRVRMIQALLQVRRGIAYVMDVSAKVEACVNAVQL